MRCLVLVKINNKSIVYLTSALDKTTSQIVSWKVLFINQLL